MSFVYLILHHNVFEIRLPFKYLAGKSVVGHHAEEGPHNSPESTQRHIAL